MNFRKLNSEVARFLFAGGLNTLLTYLLYLMLLNFLGYQEAYSISFMLGIVLSYSLNTFIVFRKPWSLKKLIQFPVVYIVQYLFGVALLTVLVGSFSFDAKLAPVLIIVLLLPMTFFMTKWVIKK